MYVFPLLFVILASLAFSFAKNGVGSFVSLGILGAAIYSVPGLIDMQSALATVSSSHRGYVAVPAAAEFVVLLSWLGLLFGLVSSSLLFPQEATRNRVSFDKKVIESFALGALLLGIGGIIYLSLTSDRILFFLVEREEQDVGAIATLWRWTPLIGIVASVIVRQPRLILVNAAILFIIFLRGDRTLVAIACAAVVAVVSERNPTWWRQLRPLQVAAFVIGAVLVFLGKSIYLTLKSGFSGHGWGVVEGLTLKQQFLFQFEPLATFSHLSYVMTRGITITPGEFLGSVFGNVLLVPSWFGISTNLYNAAVTETLSPRLGYGIAGNYMAHGYTVAGTVGAAFFYFLLPVILSFCDRQFHAGRGAGKIFWCCVGAVFAFYIHRNGLDNQLSFVRQLFIVCVGTAIIAAAVRQLSGGRPQFSVAPSQVGAMAGEEEFALRRPGAAR